MVHGIVEDYYSFECMLYFNDKLYFVDYEGADLCSYDLKNEVVSIECSLEKYCENRMFVTMAGYNGRIYIFPFNAKNICIYDVKTCKLTKLENYGQASAECCNKFISSYVWKEKVIAVSAFDASIFEMDTRTLEIQIHKIDEEQLSKYILNKNELSAFYKGEIDENSLFLPFCKGNVVLRINLHTWKVDFIEIEGNGDGYSTAVLWKDDLWLVPRRGNKLQRYNLKKGKGNIIELPVKENEENQALLFLDMIKSSEGFVALPCTCDKGYIIAYDSGQIKEYNEMQGNMMAAIQIADDFVISAVKMGMIMYRLNGVSKSTRIIAGKRECTEIISENALEGLEELIRNII